MSDVTDIVREIAEKVGTTAEKAWPLYVKWVWADALAPIVVCAGVVVLVCVVWAALWRAAKSVSEPEIVFVMRLLPGIVLAVGLLIGAIVTSDHLATVLAPEGAAIHAVVVQAVK